MLTIKEPIKLHIGRPLLSNTDSFGERIRGNYDLLGAKYAPKDLLFLFTAPPEFPEELGGMTTLIAQQNVTDVRSVTMEVVNNVVNRILLDGTENFTYQDQVYITSVLNRLGVTNVEQFMEQVRALRIENESTVHLTKLYREELKSILERALRGESAPHLPIARSDDAEEEVQSIDPRTTMSLQILRRLGTSRIYETVHNFQRNYLLGANSFHQSEMRMSEQLRFSNSLSLAEIKQQIFEAPRLSLQHHLNQYETMALFETPKSEEDVLSQAAVAALVSAVDNTVTQVLNRPQIRRDEWIYIERALYQTAYNTLSRFETYHSGGTLPPRADAPQSGDSWNHYAQELREYRTLYQNMYPRAAEFGRLLPIPPAAVEQLTHLQRFEGDENVFEGGVQSVQLTQEQRREIVQSILQGESSAAAHIDEKTAAELVLRSIEQSETSERIFDRSEIERTILAARAQEDAVHPLQMETAQVVPPPSVGEREVLTLTPREAEEQSPEILIEQLERIDRHNRTVLQNIQQDIFRREAAPPKGFDAQRTMRESLRALEEPERVLQEVYSEAAQIVHPTLTPQEEALLRNADGESRAIYERILAYEKDPEGALAQGLVKKGSMGALQVELQKAMRDNVSAQMETAERPAPVELVHERSEIVSEQFQKLMPQRRSVPQVKMPLPSVSIVHKEMPADLTEELLERIEAQRTQSTVKTVTEQDVTHRNTQEIDLTQVEKKVVTQTTEDITELVNRTLARQMRTISDQVYRQMEKRLQSERSRRGRL
ncbi:MAG: hypothetical protein IJA73_04590 [Oscillospiraceae bacterium]|nr:hypothetical protein [Oscillospiraceae bacterium]